MKKVKDNTIITIGRAYGSRGSQIGKKVADALKIPIYDKELLALEADESKIDIEYLSKFSDQKPGWLLRNAAFNPLTSERYESFEEALIKLQEKTLKHVAEQGPCIIIGKRADKYLREEYDVVSVFIHASLEKRIERVMERDGLSKSESIDKIRKMDKSRGGYYSSYKDGVWGYAENYKLCINSGDLGVDGSAEMVIRYLELTGRIS